MEAFDNTVLRGSCMQSRGQMTTIFDFPDVKSIVVCGDIHGEFEKLVHNIAVRHKMRDTLIIVAGDCGFGFWSIADELDFYFGRSMDRIADANNYIAFVRGNHDDPRYFDGERIGYERFRAVPDYSVITTCGHQILCVGGAVSIDRDSRTEGKDWWMNEGPALRPDLMAEIASNGYRIDTVVTHTAPSFCGFAAPPAFIKDAVLLADLRHERDVMDSLLSHLYHDGHPLRHWYFGHFHNSWSAAIDGVNFTLLDIMEMKELR